MKKSKKQQARLDFRRDDYNKMIAQPKIGDGHRTASGYRKPGSNKK